jgi:hypothetical protein
MVDCVGNSQVIGAELLRSCEKRYSRGETRLTLEQALKLEQQTNFVLSLQKQCSEESVTLEQALEAFSVRNLCAGGLVEVERAVMVEKWLVSVPPPNPPCGQAMREFAKKKLRKPTNNGISKEILVLPPD